MAVRKLHSLLITFLLVWSFGFACTALAQGPCDLTVNIIPSQGGTVKADCATPCQYTPGAWAHLIAIPNSGYVFDTWSGDCSGSGTNPSAVVRMDATKSCNANFLPCLNLPVQIGNTEYPSFEMAYGLAANNDIIKILATNLQESLRLDRTDIRVTLKGGYTCGFGANPSYTLLQGQMIVARGSGTVERVIVLSGTPPVITSFSANPSTVNQGKTSVLSWTIADATTASIDNGVGAVDPIYDSRTVSPTTTTTYTLTASNPYGTDTKQMTVTVVQPLLPTITTFTATPSSITSGQSVTLNWVVTNATAISIDRGLGPVAPSGSTLVSPTWNTTYTLTASNADGSVSSQAVVTVSGGLPPDPSTTAPPLDQTVATSTYSATQFLYTGHDAIQTGVAPGTIEAKRVAVIRGKVLNRDNTPLWGVTITILNHPEFGQTITRDDGMFDMVVNGGGLLTVNFRKTGYLPAQRQSSPAWEDYGHIDDTVLITQDAMLNTIDLTDTTQSFHVAQGSVVTDGDGSRQATLLIPQGTQARVYNEDGTTRPVTSLNLRLTEYTVGSNGPAAMPALLPPASAYTYAVELKAEEATLKLSGKDVLFDRPVPFYVTNFLGFPVGSAVPVGYYDSDRAAWVASENGRVIKILAISSGSAELDTDGDGLADDAAKLGALGITAQELVRLASIYLAGETLWRVQVSHLSTYDCNWPYGPPDDATGPRQPDGRRRGGGRDEDDPCRDNGRCTVEFQSQVLAESLPVDGTPFTVNYRSNWVPGFVDSYYTLDIPVSGPTVPASLRRIVMTVEVAGQRHPALGVLGFPPAPNQSYAFTWDGLDAYGRRVQGDQQATIRIGYVYGAVYMSPAEIDQAFARMSAGEAMEQILARQEITIWQTSRVMVGVWDARGLGVGGWTLSDHHVYNPSDGSLYLGNGEILRGRALGSVITTYAGGGTMYRWDALPPGGMPATDASIIPHRVTVAPDGTLYIGIISRILRINPEGMLTLFAGTVTPGFSGDGGPATLAQFDYIAGMDLGPDGSLYVCDSGNNRVRRISPDGIVTTVAGNGEPGFAGDGGTATGAQIYTPQDVAVAQDGGFYIAQATYPRIRHVGPDGIITTVAGGSASWYELNEGGLATGAYVIALGLALGPDGSLYYADYTQRIRRITPDGIVRTVGGTGRQGFSGDGGPAIEADIDIYWPIDIDVAPDGSLYFPQYFANRIRKITPGGIITSIAGMGDSVYNGSDDGSLAAAARVASPRGVAVASDGNLFTAEYQRVRRIAPPAPGIAAGDFLVPSSDGRRVYQCDASGRHLTTLEALTGALVYEFGYDNEGRLQTITDASGSVTTVERDGSGNPTAIVSPRGQRTVLSVNTDGYLTSLATPLPASWSLTYQPGGLLSSVTDPNGWTNSFSYSLSGRLIRDDDPEGGYLSLARDILPRGFQVNASTSEGRTAAFRVETTTDGTIDKTVTFSDGSRNTVRSTPEGTRVMTATDGTVSTLTLGPDPRFGMLAPLATSFTQTTPGGLSLSYAQAREVTLDQNGDPLRPVSVLTTQTVNGQTFTTLFSAVERTVTRTTSEGRQLVRSLDEKGRPIAYTVPTLEPVTFVYESHGHLAEIRQGTGAGERIIRLSYDSLGFLSQMTDPLGRVTQYTVDAAGRVRRVTAPAPDGRQTALSYDNWGNLVSVTPPGGSTHALAYNRINYLITHDPPDAPGSTVPSSFGYDLDRRLTSITRPDGRRISLTYDTGGRLGNVTLDRGTLTYDYDATSSRLAEILYPGGEFSLSYDGPLVTRARWTGTVAGQIDQAYDNFFRLASSSVNAGDSVGYTYDADGLLSGAGGLSIARDATTGLVTGTTLGTVADTWSYNGFGEPATYTSSAGGEAWVLSYTRDLFGRIIQIQETRSATSQTLAYSYDTVGRLTEVTRNGAVIAACEYDGNGNRVGYTGPSGIQVRASYDAQDRLISFGSVNYVYRADGSLQSRTDGSGTATYDYDELGNLVSVILPDGTRVDYVIDGANRRVGKRVNGAMVKGFLYKDQIHPVAELDGSGAVVSRFVYGTRTDVPDYMMRGGNIYRILSDHLGSPRFVVDAATGSVAQRLSYDAFGNLVEDTSPGFQPFGFAGGLYDTDTKLVRFGVRDYDPEAGRWTAPDPALFEGGSANLYEYVRGDPVNLTDPTGLHDIHPLLNNPLLETLPWFVARSPWLTGFADGLTHIPFTHTSVSELIRGWLDLNDLVEYCSYRYRAGHSMGESAFSLGTGLLAELNLLRAGEMAALPTSASIVGRLRHFWNSTRLIRGSATLIGQFARESVERLGEP